MYIFQSHFSGMDLLIGSFSKMNYYGHQLGTTSHLYITDHATWCVGAATKQASWMNIFYIFSIQVWVLGIVIFSIMIAIIYTYGKMDKGNRNVMWAFMSTIQITLGFVPEFSPKKFSARIILFLCLAYGLIFSTLFQSATVSKMTGNYYQVQVSTLNEAIENNYEFAGSEYAYATLKTRNETVSRRKFSLSI